MTHEKPCNILSKSLFFSKLILLIVNSFFKSFITGIVMANLGDFCTVSILLWPFKIALIKSGLKFPGSTPFFRWTILSPDKYWLTEFELIFLTVMSHPTKAITILFVYFIKLKIYQIISMLRLCQSMFLNENEITY